MRPWGGGGGEVVLEQVECWLVSFSLDRGRAPYLLATKAPHNIESIQIEE